jgi:hypothetical protein
MVGVVVRDYKSVLMLEISFTINQIDMWLLPL